MNKVIKIEDYPCGSGKTTRMIENFKEDQKYLVILPLLSEVTVLSKPQRTLSLSSLMIMTMNKEPRPAVWRHSFYLVTT